VIVADTDDTNVTLASNLTVAWLSNPNTRATGDEATQFLEAMHRTLASVGTGGVSQPIATGGEGAPPDEFTPAVTVRKSLASRDHILSLIDGKPYVTLKKHLGTHGLTPQQYRERYGLKADYPMTAPAYSERRSDLAKKIGLGAKGRGRKPAAAAPETAAAATKRGRKKLSVKG
jgi:predicted transcriptional regulator